MGKLKEPENMEDCEYFSRRVLEDGTKLTLWVPKDTKVMNINYKCIECSHESSVTDEYALPYTFYCEKCGAKILLKPLKGKAKGAKRKKRKKK